MKLEISARPPPLLLPLPLPHRGLSVHALPPAARASPLRKHVALALAVAALAGLQIPGAASGSGVLPTALFSSSNAQHSCAAVLGGIKCWGCVHAYHAQSIARRSAPAAFKRHSLSAIDMQAQ